MPLITRQSGLGHWKTNNGENRLLPTKNINAFL